MAQHNHIAFHELSADFFKVGSILFLGIGAGMTSNIYSPVFVTIAAACFVFFSIALYTHTHAFSLPQRETAQLDSSHRFLFFLFYLGFFLSITIPKSGRTISNVPITTANMVILLWLVIWMLTFIVQRSTFHIPLFRVVLVFLLYGVVSLLIGISNKNQSKLVLLDFLAFIGFIPVYFGTCSVIHTPKRLKNVIWTITIGTFLVCVYGLLQKYFGFERVAVYGVTEQFGKAVYEGVGKWNVIEGGGQKLYSTFQNGNIFGDHLAMFIPVIGGILIGASSFRKKILLAGIFLLSCYILFLTYSRGALVGTLSGFGFLALISKKVRMKSIVAGMLLFCLLLLIFWIYSDRPEVVRYDFRRIATDPNQFSAGRLERVKQVIAGFLDLPFTQKVFGLGFGGVLISPLQWQFIHTDNLYLTLLFKMGLVGVGILAIALLQLFITLLQADARITHMKYKALLYGGIAGLIASLVHNLADSLWFFPPLSANFWFLAGIMMSTATIAMKQPDSMNPDKNDRQTKRGILSPARQRQLQRALQRTAKHRMKTQH